MTSEMSTFTGSGFYSSTLFKRYVAKEKEKRNLNWLVLLELTCNAKLIHWLSTANSVRRVLRNFRSHGTSLLGSNQPSYLSYHCAQHEA